MISSASLTDEDFREAAALLKCDSAAIQAVCWVEAPGGGFLSDGRVRVLFEAHIFHRQTKGEFAQSHPNLCFPRWDKSTYATGKNADERGRKEYDRLTQAMLLDREAALMSASFGKFQIMGFNFGRCGFADVEDFFQAMNVSEKQQLRAFCQFILRSQVDDELREHRWEDFARRYNGDGYRLNSYHTKLAAAHKAITTGA